MMRGRAYKIGMRYKEIYDEKYDYIFAHLSEGGKLKLSGPIKPDDNTNNEGHPFLYESFTSTDYAYTDGYSALLALHKGTITAVKIDSLEEIINIYFGKNPIIAWNIDPIGKQIIVIQEERNRFKITIRRYIYNNS